ELESVFNVFALCDSHAAMMRADQYFSRKFVDRTRDTLCQPTAVHKEQRGVVRAYKFKKLRMNRTPNRRTRRTLCCRTAWQRLDFVQLRHVLDRDFNAEVEALLLASVNNGDRPKGHRTAHALEFRQCAFRPFWLRSTTNCVGGSGSVARSYGCV